MLDIPGIDIKHGIAMTGGTEEGYRRVLDIFRRDAAERLRMCRFFLFGDGNVSEKFPEKHLSSLITQVQALKSASATIGATELSKQAARLELAGKDRDLIFIQSNLLDFVEQLSELTQNIRTALEQEESEKSEVRNEESEDPMISNYFQELSAALKSKNVMEIDHIVEKLSKEQLDQETREILEKIYLQVLMTEFESAIKTISEYITEHE